MLWSARACTSQPGSTPFSFSFSIAVAVGFGVSKPEQAAQIKAWGAQVGLVLAA